MKKILYIFILLFSFVNLSNATDLTIDIDNLESKKINILFEKFKIAEDKNANSNEKIIKKIFNKVKDNLNTTGLFSVKKINESIYDNNNKNTSSVDLNTAIINKYSKTTMDAVLGGYLETNSEDKVELRAIGAGAVNQAVKSIAVARGYVAANGMNLVCIPAFGECEVEDTEKSMIRFIIKSEV